MFPYVFRAPLQPLALCFWRSESRWPTLGDSSARSQSSQAGQRKVSLTPLATGYQIVEEVFDQLILATGTLVGDILEPFRIWGRCSSPKGQLRDYQLSEDLESYPVVMPEREWDLIPLQVGKLSLGATHENDMGFDLTVDETCFNKWRRQPSSLSSIGRKRNHQVSV